MEKREPPSPHQIEDLPTMQASEPVALSADLKSAARLPADSSVLASRVATRRQPFDEKPRFWPELLQAWSEALEVLDENGLRWLADFMSIETEHDEFGLTVSEISEDTDPKAVLKMLQAAFPRWKYFIVWRLPEPPERPFRVRVFRDPIPVREKPWNLS